MSKPLFSIVIPTYQSAHTIKPCIESVLGQTFNNFEIIVQDGQSTDETCNLVRTFGDSRICLYSEKDYGVYDAMNRAINKLLGEWVLFLGSDDKLYANDTLAKLDTFLVSNPPTDLVYGNVIMVGDSHWVKDGEIYMGETHLALLFEKNLCHQSILYNKRIFERGELYNQTYPVLADYDFNLRCFARYKVTYTTQVIAAYSTGGLSSITPDKPFARDKWINIIRYYRYRLLSPSFAVYKRDIKGGAKHLLRNGTVRERMIALAIYLYFKFV